MKSRLSRAILCAVAVVSTDCGGCRKAPAPPAKATEAAGKAEPGEHHQSGEEKEELPEEVKLTDAALKEAGIHTWKVEPLDLGRVLVLTGTVGHNENRLVQVAANVRGRVSAIPVDLGARVRKGTPVAEIESVDLGKAREDFLRELSAFRVASRGYERAKALVQAKAISAGEFQAREGDYLARRTAAQAAERALRLYGESSSTIDRLREALEGPGTPASAEPPRLALLAPFDGRVIDRKVTPGSLVEALQPLLTVADLSSLWVFLQAYEKDLPLLHEGLPVVIHAEAFPENAFNGRIDFLGSVVDTATRTIRVRATVSNREEKLRPGMFVKARIIVSRPRAESREVVAVPQAAVQTLEGRTMVFVLSEPGVFTRRVVETGRSFDGNVEILAGVKAGEEIVTDGSFVIKSQFAKAMLKDED